MTLALAFVLSATVFLALSIVGAACQDGASSNNARRWGRVGIASIAAALTLLIVAVWVQFANT